MMYEESELLDLSGVQHYAFCPRQWALIHVEQQWLENGATVDGQHVHRRCHDSGSRETRGDTLVCRSLQVISYGLGLKGICDVVEFRLDDTGVALAGREGLFLPFPIEYKRGKRKDWDEDRVQVCAQALALEEMFCCSIPQGAIYYDMEKRREIVFFDETIRQRVKMISEKMHSDYKKGYTQKPTGNKRCSGCSLKDICLPKLSEKESVEEYIAANIR